MHVKDIMEQPVVTCSDSTNSNHAAQLMWEHDFGSLPVVDSEGRLAGIVTDRDICMGAYTKGATLAEIPVASVMTRHALACHLADTIETAEELMREAQIRRLPVIDNDGCPVGVVTINDLARRAAQEREAGRDLSIVQTLAAISAPRAQSDRRGIDQPASLETPAGWVIPSGT